MRHPFTPVLAAALLLIAAAAWAGEPPKPADATDILANIKTKVTLDVQDVPLENVLRILSKQFNLSIITAKDVTTVISASFKNVTLEQTLNSLVTINGFAYRVKGNVIEVYVPRPGEGAPTERPRIQTFVLQYANAESTKTLLKPFLTANVGKIEADVPGNTLIVYDMPGALEALAKVIEKIDQPEPQVTIGAEIIEAAVDVTEKLGIDWQTRVSATGSSRPITFPFTKNNSHSRFVPSNLPAGGGDDDDEFSAGDSFPYATRDDFVFGKLDATGLKAVLDVLRSDGGTNLIANPEITTLNNREAKINIGNTVPVPIYTTNLETGVSAVTGFEEVETGTILAVTPQISVESQTVTLEVKPEISEILGYKGQFDERPIVASRKAETFVRLRNGESLVIGGLVSDKTEEVVNKIPILGDAPLLGWFFKSKRYVKYKSSLYIFVTPRIIDDEGYRRRAKLAANRLRRNGLKNPESGSDDLRNPGSSPFE